MAKVQAFLLWLLVTLRLVRQPDLVMKLVPDHPDPDTMDFGVIYVVGGAGYRKWAYFRCPADHEEIIQLSLMPERRPRWKVTRGFLGRPTIHPSVRQLDGSYAHFWVKNGRIDWCADSGRQPATLSEQWT
jgi:Family of unknown function (DUF6527)